MVRLYNPCEIVHASWMQTMLKDKAWRAELDTNVNLYTLGYKFKEGEEKLTPVEAPEVLEAQVTTLKQYLITDLITQGLPVEHFDETFKFSWRNQVYRLKVADLKMLDIVTSIPPEDNAASIYYTTHRRLFESYVHIPAINSQGKLVLLKFEHLLATTLVQKYEQLRTQYVKILNALIEEVYNFNPQQELLTELYTKIYAKSTFTDTLSRRVLLS